MATTTRQRTALLAVCAGLALNGLVLGPLWLLAPSEAFSETVAVPAFALSQRISWVLLTCLVVLVPALLTAGRHGTTPPAWLTPLVQLALSAQAATAFVMGFVAPWLAGVAAHTLDVPGGTFQLAMTAVWIAFVLVMVVGATALWRAGHSRPGAVLAVIGAVATPGVGPIGSAILAVGLGLVAVGQLRAGQRDAAANPLQHSPV